GIGQAVAIAVGGAVVEGGLLAQTDEHRWPVAEDGVAVARGQGDVRDRGGADRPATGPIDDARDAAAEVEGEDVSPGPRWQGDDPFVLPDHQACLGNDGAR